MSTTTPQLEQVDVRGPRFAAWVTTGVLVLTLILSTFSLPAATVVLALQAIVFAVGAVLGPKRSPYGQIFGKLVAPATLAGQRTRTRGAAALRAVRRLRLRTRRHGRFPGRVDDRRHRRHRLRLVRGPAQRRVRHLPRLPDLSTRRKAAKYRAALPPRENACPTTLLNPC